jgi:hypothetical protein
VPRAQVLRHLFDGGDDVREIGVLRFPQRRRNADADRVGVGQHGKVGGGLEPSGLDQPRDTLARYIGDV